MKNFRILIILGMCLFTLVGFSTETNTPCDDYDEKTVAVKDESGAPVSTLPVVLPTTGQ